MRLKSQSSNDREWDWERNHGNGMEWSSRLSMYSRRLSVVGLHLRVLEVREEILTNVFKRTVQRV